MLHNVIVAQLVEKYEIRIMAEIGIFKCRTLRKVLRSEYGKSMKQYWAIDPWKVLDERYGKTSLVTQREWDILFWKACAYMPWFPQLRIIRMDSEEASRLFPLPYFEGYFDFVYIDASHFYEDVVNDIRCWLPLIKKGGHIGGHDYGKGGKKGHRVKKAVLEFFEEKDLELYSSGVWMKHLKNKKKER